MKNKASIVFVVIFVLGVVLLTSPTLYSGLHFGPVSAVKKKVQDLKDKILAENTHTQNVGTSGGTISTSGANIVIPAGVLSSNADITVTRIETPQTTLSGATVVTDEYKIVIPEGKISAVADPVKDNSTFITIEIPIVSQTQKSLPYKSLAYVSDDNKISSLIVNGVALYQKYFTIGNNVQLKISLADIRRVFGAKGYVGISVAVEIGALVENVTGFWQDFATSLYKTSDGISYTKVSSAESASTKIPVIFVHGLQLLKDNQQSKSHETWKNLIPHLISDKYTLYTLQYYTGDNISTNADDFANIITTLLPNTSNIVIVAHSMGGLVSHGVVQGKKSGYEKIKKIISLGTPYHGTPFVQNLKAGLVLATSYPVFAKTNHLGINGLQWDNYDNRYTGQGDMNKLLSSWNSAKINTGVYTAISGVGCNNILLYISSYALTNIEKINTHDGVVPWVSAVNVGFGIYNATYTYNGYDHLELLNGKTGNTSVFDKVKSEIQKVGSSINTGEMVYIPAGNFTMGSTSGYGDEQPVHTVYLDAYYIDKYEVTNGQYKQFIDAGGYNNSSYWTTDGWTWKTSNSMTQPYYWTDTTFGYGAGRENLPVVEVSWYESYAYANWAGKRLPTEAEWEKAARWTDERTYPWGEGIDSTKCNYNSNIGHTTSVGNYESGKSYYGCYDMAGNVWEWCQDWYGTPYPSGTVSNPTGPATGSYRVERGGSWYNDDDDCRTANRSYNYPFYRNFSIGFRCASNP